MLLKMAWGRLPPSLPCELFSNQTSIEVSCAWIFLRLYTGWYWSGLGLHEWIRLIGCKDMKILPLLRFLVPARLGMAPWYILIVRQVVHWGMIKLLRLKPIYCYYDVHIRVPTIFRIQLSGKRPTDGKYGVLASITMLLILVVSKIVWGRLFCHSYQPPVGRFPWWTLWFGSRTWPQVDLQVLLGRSSNLLIFLVQFLLIECTASHSWIILSMLLRSILLLTGKTHNFLLSLFQM